MAKDDPGSAAAIGQFGSALLTTLQNMVVAINNWTQALLSVWPRTTGSFTMTAASSLAVPQPNVKSTSIVIPTPTNASAATLQSGANSLFVASKTAGVGFTVTTAAGGAAAGTETFDYAVFSPS